MYLHVFSEGVSNLFKSFMHVFRGDGERSGCLLQQLDFEFGFRATGTHVRGPPVPMRAG